MSFSTTITIIISAVALGITVYNTMKNNKRNAAADYEAKIVAAAHALKECNEQLIQCGREKDELRREKFTLLEQIALRAVAGTPPSV
jgi:hypothetical protein